MATNETLGEFGQLVSAHLVWISLATAVVVLFGIDALESAGYGVVGWIVAAIGVATLIVGVVVRVLEAFDQ